MYCTNCGKEISEESKYCKYCGAFVGDIKEKQEDFFENNTPTNENQQQKSETKTKSGSEINVCCLLGFIFAMADLLMLTFIFSIAGLVLSIIGYKQAKEKKQKLLGLGLAGIITSSVFMGIYLLVSISLCGMISSLLYMPWLYV